MPYKSSFFCSAVKNHLRSPTTHPQKALRRHCGTYLEAYGTLNPHLFFPYEVSKIPGWENLWGIHFGKRGVAFLLIYYIYIFSLGSGFILLSFCLFFLHPQIRRSLPQICVALVAGAADRTTTADCLVSLLWAGFLFHFLQGGFIALWADVP